MTRSGLLNAWCNIDYLAWVAPDRILMRHLASGAEFDDLPLLAIDTSSGKSIVRCFGSNAAALQGLENIALLEAVDEGGKIASFVGLTAIINHALFTLKDTGAKTILAATLMLQLVRTEGALTPDESKSFSNLAFGCGLRKLWVACGIEPIDLSSVKNSSFKCQSFEPKR